MDVHYLFVSRKNYDSPSLKKKTNERKQQRERETETERGREGEREREREGERERREGQKRGRLTEGRKEGDMDGPSRNKCEKVKTLSTIGLSLHRILNVRWSWRW